MATIRELQMKFTASTKGIRTALKGVVDDMKGLQKETDKFNKDTQKSASDTKGAYRTMADGSKVYRDSMGKLRDEMGRFVQEQDTILQNASKSQKFFDNLGNSAITAGNKVQSISGQINTVGNVARDFGGTLTKYVTLPVAGLATLLGGTALSKGFSRLLDIDTAQAKLKGLGHDAQNVETIMNSATQSVKGTAFGLGEAATTAANAVAAGIEPGEELTKYLTLTGDAAAIAGTDMNEMGSIFNKVQTNNKIQAEEMNQLLDRGVPIIKLLAEQMNVAEEDVRDLAAAGEISAEDFLGAIDKGFGGAAKIMGETSFQAALDNMWASVGRIGANFLDAGGEAGGFFSQMKPLIGELTEWFSSMEDNAAQWGVKFGESFSKAIEWIRDFIGQIKALDDWQKKLLGWGAVIAVALGPILTVLGSIAIFISKVGFAIAPVLTRFGTLSKAVADAGGLMVWLRGGLATLAKRFSFLLGPVGIAIGVILTLGTAFVTAYKKSETFRNFIDGIGERISNAIGWLSDFKDGIIGLFKDDGVQGLDILTSIGLSDELAQALWDFTGHFIEFYHNVNEQIENVKTAFKGIVSFFKGDIEGGIDLLRSIGLTDGQIENVFESVTKIKRAFEEFKLDIQLALSTVTDFFKEKFGEIFDWWNENGGPFLDAVAKFFGDVKDTIAGFFGESEGDFNSFVTLITGIWDSLWATISAVVEAAWSQIETFIEIGMAVAQGLLEMFTHAVNGDWDEFWNSLGEMVSTIKDSILEHITNLKDIAIDLFFQLFGGVIDWFTQSRDGLLEKAREIDQAIVQKFTEMKDSVVNKFVELKDGAIGKVTEMYESVTGWFSNLHTGVTTKVTETKDSVVGKFTEIKDGAIQRVTEMVAPILAPFVSIYEGARLRMEQLWDILVFIFNTIKTSVVLIVTTLYNQVAQWFLNMYTRVSTIASNIYTWVRDRFVSLRDSVVNTVTNLYERVSSWFTNLYTRVTTIVGNVRNWVVERFNSMRDAVANTVMNLYNRVATWFSNLYNRVSTIVSNVRNRVSQIFGNLRDRVVSTVSNLYNRVSSFFTNIYNTIRDKMLDAKNKAVGFATDLYDGAKAQFENLSSAASDMMDKIGQWIDEKKTAVVDKAKSLGIDIANGAINGFNKMIGGINNVASLLGYDGNLITEIPTYSTGTNYHPGGAAIVGDKGPGNSVGGGSSTRELIELPNGKQYIADGNVLIPNAPKGMKVKSNRDTESWLSKRSGGSNSNVFSRAVSSVSDFAKDTTSKAISGAKKAVGKVVDTADAVWEYAKNPGQLVSDIIGNVDFNLPTKALEFAKLGLGKIKSVATDYIKGLFDKADGAGDGSHILSKQIYQRFGRYTGGLSFNGGRHYGLDTAHKHEPLLSPINGVVSRIWNDYGGGNSLQVSAGKYTWWFMHLSKILAKMGERITTGQKIAVTGATGNYLSGSGHLHTQVMQGGIGNAYAIDPLPILRNLQGAGSAAKGIASKIGGYFKGGITSGLPELAWLNEEGFRESIISHNPAHKQRSENIWQTTGDKLGFGKNDEELRLMREENALLKQIVINTGDTADNTEAIKHKNPKIVIDEYEKKRDKRKDDTTIIY